MRTMVMAVVAGLATAAAAPAQSDNWANKLFTFKGGPQSLYHDFGNVPYGSMLHYNFPIYNPWAIPIEITEIRVSCGCVTARASKTVLQPRETAYIEANMDTLRFKRPESRTVSIHVSVGPQYISTATVQVSANARGDVVLQPGQINFGVVAAGQSPAKSVDVEYAGVLDWRINEIVKNDAPVEVVPEEWYRQPGKVGYHLRVTLKPDAPAGPLTKELLLRTNDPASPLVPVLVEATIQAPLTVVPSALSLGNAKVGDTVSKRVIVRGNEPFKIIGVEGVGDAITVDLPEKADVQQILTIKYQPKAAGEMHQQLKIKTDLPQEAAVTLKVEGSVAP
ncbi:MAG TPA: DUF1573 domain-containing protein [Gemmataceae bacterium]|nr:DUF1573 domain-containing protein [Gemmataceae bacterium]